MADENMRDEFLSLRMKRGEILFEDKYDNEFIWLLIKQILRYILSKGSVLKDWEPSYGQDYQESF